MTIKHIQIKNFRSIAQCDLDWVDFLALIGDNNAGKSNIIYALQLFLNQNKPEGELDFLDTSLPIEITATFNNLTAQEKAQITDAHRAGDEFIVKKTYSLNEDTKTTSIKDGSETNVPPKGPQNILSDALPELYILPALKEIPNEIKMTGTTNFGKLLTEVIENAVGGFEDVDDLMAKLKGFFDSEDPDMPLNKVATEITDILNKQFRSTKVKLAPKTLTRKDILKTLDVLVDDGYHSSIYQKGHGLQRAVIFSILCLWANKLNSSRPSNGKEKKGIIVAIEEPEIYLHPQQQKIVYQILKDLSQQSTEQIQIIYATHSSFFVHVEDYKNIVLVRKPDISTGTVTSQCTQEIFTPDSKDEFSLLCQFDPERNELFFARKIVLVEGDTEKMSLPILLDKAGINPINNNISIIECGSKSAINFFFKVLNAFNTSEKLLDFVVMHDADIPWKDQNDPDKTSKEQQAQQENLVISNLCSQNNIPLHVFTPDFERELGLQVNDKNKPYKAKRAVAESTFIIPANLQTFFTTNLS